MVENESFCFADIISITSMLNVLERVASASMLELSVLPLLHGTESGAGMRSLW